METSSWNNVIPFGVYLTLSVLFLFLYFETASLHRTKYIRVEDVKLDCQPVIDGTPKARRFSSFHLFTPPIIDDFLKDGEICTALHRYFYFQKTGVSVEEKEFPIAFGFVVHVDPIQGRIRKSKNERVPASSFKSILMRIPRCFDNVRIQIGDEAYPPTHKNGVMNNVYQCVNELTSSGSKWEYYQFVAAHDVPLKTNLEMVRILKALNGSINTEIRPYSKWRFGIQRPEATPVPLYQGGMGVILPRKAAEFLVDQRKTAYLLNYLNKTHLPYETFWATIAANKKSFHVPGSLDGKMFTKAQQVTVEEEFDMESQTVDNIDSTFIARFEISTFRSFCSQDPMCFFNVTDISLLLRRPEMFAHKIFMTIHPAAYICLAKELRRRSLDPVPFNASSYSRLPSVELNNGIPLEDLSHPEWMAVPIKYEKF